MTEDAYVKETLRLPGLTDTVLMHMASRCTLFSDELLDLGFPMRARVWTARARALIDAAPHFPTPPRVPANATEAG